MRNIQRIPAIVLLGSLVIAGCARREEADDAAASPEAAPVASATPDTTPAALPPPELASIRVQVAIAPEAEAALRSASQQVSVEVIFAGDPAPGKNAALNELGLVELGKDTRTLPGAGSLDFPEDLIDQSRLDLILGQPQVLVNVRSDGASNLLRCNFYWETLKVAGEAPVEVSCSSL